MHTKLYVLHTATWGNDPVYFSLISIIDYRYCSRHFGRSCYRNVFCKVMPELKIVSASFKVGSLVLGSSVAQFQHHYSFESWVRFGSVLSSVVWKKSLSCLLNSWSQGLKGQCRTLGLTSCEGSRGSSWCIQLGFRGTLPLCAVWMRPVAIISWLKLRDVKPGSVSYGSHMRTKNPNVLRTVRG